MSLVFVISYSKQLQRIVGVSVTEGVIVGVTETLGVIDTDGALRRSTSSLKYKNDVRNYDKGLAEVLQMRPVYYKGNNDGDTIFAGLIAEEVNEILPDVVIKNEEGEPDSVSYGRITAVLIEAIKDLQQQINVLNSK